MIEASATGSRGFPLLPVGELQGAFRDKVEKVAALGGDTSFFQFAAHNPQILELYWGQFYRDVFFAGRLPVRIKEIARLRLAGLNGCSFCQVGDRASALENGLTEQEADALLHGDGHAASFTDAEQAAADVATACSNFDPDAVMSDELLSRLQTAFDAGELVELLTVVGFLTGMARMLLAAGFIPRTCPTD